MFSILKHRLRQILIENGKFPIQNSRVRTREMSNKWRLVSLVTLEARLPPPKTTNSCIKQQRASPCTVIRSRQVARLSR